MRVVILGCGPAGLMGAHAASILGHDVRILSKKRKSFMNGAQYLHMPIPMSGPALEPFLVRYSLLGSPEAYRLKVYGPKWDGTVSPEDLAEEHHAWDIRQTYDWLWDTYGNYVSEWEATPATLRHVLDTWGADLVVSTVPAPLLCAEGHTFQATKIYATDKCIAPGMLRAADNVVVCNGEESPSWYRQSRIQGFENTEWPGFGPKPPLNPIWEVTKPTRNNCTCFPEVMRCGRYGNWSKGVLSHETFQEVYQACVTRTTVQS